MADVSLNGLKVKTDSLPNDWYVSLINPKSSEPAEIMTVAKFIEMFTPKQPEATESSKGVLSSGVYKNIISKYKDYTNPVGYYKAIKIKTSLKLIRYGGYNFYCKLGQTQNSLLNQIVDINIKVWDYNFERTAPISLGQNFIESIVFCVDSDDTFTIYVNFNATLNLAGGVTSLLFRLQGNSNSVVSIEGVNEKYTPGSHSKEIITNIPNTINSYSSYPNNLTDTISDNYSILPPPPANCVPNYSKSASSDEQFAVSAISETDNPDGSIPVKTEPSGEQYVWSIDKIGKAVLELQEENKRLKQILNISDDSEVQQM